MIRLLLALIVLASIPTPAWAARVQVDLLSEVSEVSPGSTFHVGLRMKIPEGWHVYWRNPGDSGLPPQVIWTLPDGFRAGPIEWPVPERFLEQELMTYGYRNEVVFPVAIMAPAGMWEGQDSVTIAADVRWLECKDVCLPGSAKVRLTFPARADSAVIQGARRRVPRSPEGWRFRAQGGSRVVSLRFLPPPGMAVKGAYFYADQPLVTEYAAPQGFENMMWGYRVTLKPAANSAGIPSRLTGVLVVEGRGTSPSSAVNVNVPVEPGNPAPVYKVFGFRLVYVEMMLAAGVILWALVNLKLRR